LIPLFFFKLNLLSFWLQQIFLEVHAHLARFFYLFFKKGNFVEISFVQKI